MACTVHRTHRPRPLRTVWHHVQPLAMHGPDVPANKVEVCDTGHYSIHRLLGDLIRNGVMRRGGTHAERAFAQRGYDAWTAAGRPGQPVFELHPEETA